MWCLYLADSGRRLMMTHSASKSSLSRRGYDKLRRCKGDDGDNAAADDSSSSSSASISDDKKRARRPKTMLTSVVGDPRAPSTEVTTRYVQVVDRTLTIRCPNYAGSHPLCYTHCLIAGYGVAGETGGMPRTTRTTTRTTPTRMTPGVSPSISMQHHDDAHAHF